MAQTHDSRHATFSLNLRCQMRKSRMVQLPAVLAAAAISLPLLASNRVSGYRQSEDHAIGCNATGRA